MRVEVLYFDGCPGHEALLPRLRRLLDEAGVGEPPVLRRVESDEDARRQRFLGSPTVRVDGVDVEPGAGARDDFGLTCRLYAVPGGRSHAPSDDLLRAALRGAAEVTRGRGPSATTARCAPRAAGPAPRAG